MMTSSTPSRKNLYLGDCSGEQELFQAIIEQLDLMDLYGRDWQGMQEHFFYDPNDGIPKVLVVHGVERLLQRVPHALVELEKCFDVCREQEPSFVVEYTEGV